MSAQPQTHPVQAWSVPFTFDNYFVHYLMLTLSPEYFLYVISHHRKNNIYIRHLQCTHVFWEYPLSNDQNFVVICNRLLANTTVFLFSYVYVICCIHTLSHS